MFHRARVSQTVTDPVCKPQPLQQQPHRPATLPQRVAAQQPVRVLDTLRSRHVRGEATTTAPSSSSSSAKAQPSLSPAETGGLLKRRAFWPQKRLIGSPGGPATTIASSVRSSAARSYKSSPSVPAQLFEFLRINKDRLNQMTLLSRSSAGYSEDAHATLRFEKQQLLHSLQDLFEKMTADDFNVSKADVLPGVSYQEVYSGPEMTICVFTLSAGSRLPLHDHPEMHVFGRLLLGRLRVTSYDLMPKPDLEEAQWPREVVLEGDDFLETAPVTFSLGPDRGNLHELLALEDCAFFDVLFPSYDSEAGRHCTYFNHWMDSSTGRHYVAPEQPWGLSMRQRPYRGPPFNA